MDGQRFDRITRAMAAGASRRSVIKGLLGLGGGATASHLLTDQADARAIQTRSTIAPPKGPTCPLPFQLCAGDCCPQGHCKTDARTGVQKCCNASSDSYCGGDACCASGLCTTNGSCCDDDEQVCGSICCPTTDACTRNGNQDVCCNPETHYPCGLECCTQEFQCCDRECCSNDHVCLARAFGGEVNGIEEETCCPVARTCDNHCCDGECYFPEAVLAAPVSDFDRNCCPAGMVVCENPDSSRSCIDPAKQCCARADCLALFDNAGQAACYDCFDNTCLPVLPGQAGGCDACQVCDSDQVCIPNESLNGLRCGDPFDNFCCSEGVCGDTCPTTTTTTTTVQPCSECGLFQTCDQSTGKCVEPCTLWTCDSSCRNSCYSSPAGEPLCFTGGGSESTCVGCTSDDDCHPQFEYCAGVGQSCFKCVSRSICAHAPVLRTTTTTPPCGGCGVFQTCDPSTGQCVDPCTLWTCDSSCGSNSCFASSAGEPLCLSKLSGFESGCNACTSDDACPIGTHCLGNGSNCSRCVGYDICAHDPVPVTTTIAAPTTTTPSTVQPCGECGVFQTCDPSTGQCVDPCTLWTCNSSCGNPCYSSPAGEPLCLTQNGSSSGCSNCTSDDDCNPGARCFATSPNCSRCGTLTDCLYDPVPRTTTAGAPATIASQPATTGAPATITSQPPTTTATPTTTTTPTLPACTPDGCAERFGAAECWFCDEEVGCDEFRLTGEPCGANGECCDGYCCEGNAICIDPFSGGHCCAPITCADIPSWCSSTEDDECGGSIDCSNNCDPQSEKCDEFGVCVSCMQESEGACVEHTDCCAGLECDQVTLECLRP